MLVPGLVFVVAGLVVFVSGFVCWVSGLVFWLSGFALEQTHNILVCLRGAPLCGPEIAAGS